MKVLGQCAILFAICLAGELLRAATKLPVPGNVFGMVLLLILLCAGILKKEHISTVSDFLLRNMTFFFIPSGVAILVSYQSIAKVLVPYLLIVVFTTLIVMGATGHLAQLVQRLAERRKKNKAAEGGREHG